MTDRPDDGDRGAGELILGALAGSALLPFLHAVATKAGEDVYQLVRDKLSRGGRRKAKAEIRETGTMTLTARDSRVVLKIPQRITPTMAALLENVRLPLNRSGWSLVSWDRAQGRWTVENISEPPDADAH